MPGSETKKARDRERMKRIRALRGWQPIETAPKDGKTVLCFWPELGGDRDVGMVGEPIIGSARYMKPAAGFTEHWCFEGKWTPYDPTHWMALPPPPKPST